MITCTLADNDMTVVRGVKVQYSHTDVAKAEISSLSSVTRPPGTEFVDFQVNCELKVDGECNRPRTPLKEGDTPAIC